MASHNIFNVILIATIFTPCIFASEFIVGDGNGWMPFFDYQAWASGKQFRVGDKLVFKYPAGLHTVVKVNGTGFHDCVAPAGTEVLDSGNDVITLSGEGRKWYICNVAKHCAVGKQKLLITVLAGDQDGSSPAPSPSPTTSTSGSVATAPFRFYGFMAPVFAFLMMFLF